LQHLPDEGRETTMRKGADLRARRDPPRTDPQSELPVVAALLVMAVVVAVVAAGGPVLDLLSGMRGLLN
jgi:hypothetical protein